MNSSQIAEQIRARIESGQLKPGARAPSARQIMRKWGVANATASKVLAILSDAGLVRAIPGVGTVVVEPALSQARIVSAGLAIADREGLSAVTIRRVASELRVSAMSLYRYFPSKEQLLLLLIDAAFIGTELPPANPARDVRAQLEAAARLQWAIYSEHPWLAGALSISRPQLVPNGMRHTEFILRVLDGFGLSPQLQLVAATTLLNFVRGLAVNLESEAQAEQETGQSRQAHLDQQEARFREIAANVQLRTLARVAGDRELDLDMQMLFEFGLARLLDGLMAFLEKR
jgi:AcrR family transcriptional regulator